LLYCERIQITDQSISFPLTDRTAPSGWLGLDHREHQRRHLWHRAQRPIAKAVVDEISSNDPVRAVLDVERVMRLLEQATPFDEMHTVPLSIDLICFLRQFYDFRR
jgi:hypothetical protein